MPPVGVPSLAELVQLRQHLVKLRDGDTVEILIDLALSARVLHARSLRRQFPIQTLDSVNLLELVLRVVQIVAQPPLWPVRQLRHWMLVELIEALACRCLRMQSCVDHWRYRG